MAENRKVRVPENVRKIHEDKKYTFDFVMADKIFPKTQPWFWDQILPLHTSTLFAGAGGIGKTQLLLFLAAHTSNGKSFKAGGQSHQLEKGSVIIFSGEDDAEYQITPKLIAQGADISKIAIVKTMSVNGQKKKLIDLESCITELHELIDSIGNVKLIIVDPVQYFTGSMRDYINNTVSNFINNLSEIAKEKDLALIMNKHTRKKSAGTSVASAVDEVAGSGAWINCPRQSWIMHPNPSNEDQILFMNLKVNIAKKGTKSMAYSIKECEINNPYGDGKIKTTRMEWIDELIDISADEALSTVKVTGKEQLVEQLIINFLKNKPLEGYASSDVYKEINEKNEINRKTFYKVRSRLIQEGILKETVIKYRKEVLLLTLVDHNSY